MLNRQITVIGLILILALCTVETGIETEAIVKSDEFRTIAVSPSAPIYITLDSQFDLYDSGGNGQP